MVNISSKVGFSGGPSLRDRILVDSDVGDEGVDFVVSSSICWCHSSLLLFDLQVVEQSFIINILLETDLVVKQFVLLECLFNVLVSY